MRRTLWTLTLALIPLITGAQGATSISGTDLGSGRVVTLTGTDLGSGRLVDRFRVSHAQMNQLFAAPRFARAVRRLGPTTVEAADGYVLRASAARGDEADCLRETCYIQGEGETRSLIVSRASPRRR